MRCTRDSYISSIRYHNGTAAQSWDPELLEESCSLMLLVLLLAPTQFNPVGDPAGDPAGDAAGGVAGDPPPSLETPTSTTAPPTAAPQAPRPRVVVLQAVGLGVDRDLITATTDAVRSALAPHADVMTSALSPADVDTLGSCVNEGCAAALERLGAAGVVTTSVMPMATALTVTVRLKSPSRAWKQHETGPADGLASMCQRSVASLPLAALAQTRATPEKLVPAARPPLTPTPKTPETPSTASSSTPSMFSIEKGSGEYPPITMLLVSYALSLVPLAGSPLILPMVQGLVASTYGPQLVGVAYPNWLMATAAGYATYAVGFIGGGALYVGGVVTLSGFGDPLIGGGMILAGAGLALGALVLEPLIFTAASSMGATWSSPTP